MFSCDGNQSDGAITILSLCYKFYVKNHKQHTNDPSDKITDHLKTC